MTTWDSFSVYLRGLPADEIGYQVLDDGRHWLDITDNVKLIVRPERDDVPAVIAGLRKLAATVSEMADALEGIPPFAPGPGTDGGTGAS